MPGLEIFTENWPRSGEMCIRDRSNEELSKAIEETLAQKGPAICEIFVSLDQKFEPKSATKRLADGTLVSAPLEDLAPFLDREEFLKNMIIEPVKE